MATTTTTTDVQVATDLLDDVTSIASRLHLTPDEAVDAALRRYLSVERWRLIQEEGQRRAEEHGIRTQDDVEDFLDSLPD